MGMRKNEILSVICYDGPKFTVECTSGYTNASTWMQIYANGVSFHRFWNKGATGHEKSSCKKKYGMNQVSDEQSIGAKTYD